MSFAASGFHLTASTWPPAVIAPRKSTTPRPVPRHGRVDLRFSRHQSDIDPFVSVLVDESAGKSGDLYIRSVCFSPDGKYLATGAEDKQIRVRRLS